MEHLAAAKQLWDSLGLPADVLSHLHLTSDPDPAVDSSFKIGTAAQVSVFVEVTAGL